jgi:two-component system LytT family sensor kinase
MVERIADYIFRRQRWVMHVFFWFFVLIFYAVFFGRKNSNFQQTLFFVGLLMPVTIGTAYWQNYFLLPRYLMKGRYGAFFLYFLYTLTASLLLEMMIVVFTFVIMAEVKVKTLSPASVDIVFLLTSLLMVVFFAGAIKILLHWRASKEEYQKLMREKVETELKFLKIQLNPHFLFNTLNNLYYLASEKSDKAPQAILQLSEMLDYVMNSSKMVFVPLADELKQVDNYVALERLRYEDRIEIDKRIAGDTAPHTIGPMMLITLVENAFKHGAMKTAGKAWIRIDVDCRAKEVKVAISNGWARQEGGNGIGLQNLRNQLDHLYPRGYQFKVDDQKPGEYSVNLSLSSKG